MKTTKTLPAFWREI